MRILFLAIALACVLTLPANAGVVAGGTGGGAMLVKDGEVKLLGEVLTDVGYRFDYNNMNQGELGLLYGAQIDAGQAIGMMYRHLRDINPGNEARPGFGIGFIGIGHSELTELDQTTIFAGGGPVLSLTLSNGEFLGYAEYWHSLAGDDASIMRFGVRAALAP